MQELIYKQEAHDKLESMYLKIEAERGYNDVAKGLRIACKAIGEIKEVDTEPVRHGRWNYRHEDDWCYCTACGTDAEGSDGECLETDYCPHCGARMDGGADNG